MRGGAGGVGCPGGAAAPQGVPWNAALYVEQVEGLLHALGLGERGLALLGFGSTGTGTGGRAPVRTACTASSTSRSGMADSAPAPSPRLKKRRWLITALQRTACWAITSSRARACGISSASPSSSARLRGRTKNIWGVRACQSCSRSTVATMLPAPSVRFMVSRTRLPRMAPSHAMAVVISLSRSPWQRQGRAASCTSTHFPCATCRALSTE